MENNNNDNNVNSNNNDNNVSGNNTNENNVNNSSYNNGDNAMSDNKGNNVSDTSYSNNNSNVNNNSNMAGNGGYYNNNNNMAGNGYYNNDANINSNANMNNNTNMNNNGYYNTNNMSNNMNGNGYNNGYNNGYYNNDANINSNANMNNNTNMNNNGYYNTNNMSNNMNGNGYNNGYNNNGYNNNGYNPYKVKRKPNRMSPAVVVASIICGTVMFLGIWAILIGSFNGYNNNGYNPYKVKRKPNRMSPAVVVASIICGTVMFLGIWAILIGSFFGNLFKALVSDITAEEYMPENRVDVIYVMGTIAEDSSTYNHTWTLNTVDSLIYDEGNKGILLYIDSPGGGVFESDELYNKLMEYKEATGRPVYAYMASTAASGGLYVSMAADKIYANRMAMTGSIGVIMSSIDTSKLEEMIGIKEENITSGPNKAMGNPLTDEQRKILQSLVDESYEYFVDVVSEGRGLDREAVYKLADGRVYSPKQAQELGLIDGVLGYDDTVREMLSGENLTDCEVYQQEAPTDWMSELLSMKSDITDKQALSHFSDIKKYIESNNTPKLMYYME